MEVFAKNANDWGATLTVDESGEGKFNWKILIEDRRRDPPATRCITSPVQFASVRETIVDGHAVLEVLMPEKL